MLDVDQRSPQNRPSSLAQWAYRAIGQPGVRLRVRLRGNNLHVLCESLNSLQAETIVQKFSHALQTDAGRSLLAINPKAPIYQLIIYGRRIGHPQPDWIKSLPLNSFEPSLVPPPFKEEPEDLEIETNPERLLISNKSLALSGATTAIARYLGDTLMPLGVSVKVTVKKLPNAAKLGRSRQELREQERNLTPQKNSELPSKRLWVICTSDYSPDSSLLAEPIIQKLRDLQLQGFQDAAICSQVRGEVSPEWILRVDLTPPEAMLKDWASWGDVQAISRLINKALAKSEISARTVLKDVTLHLFCSALDDRRAALPEQETAVNIIASVLERLAPQGIEAATIYGVEAHHQEVSSEPEVLGWIDWLKLPASSEPALAEPTFSLAQQGNLDALTFLLQRLLNPNLDRRLATGGIHLKIRRKQDLLHIMSEAPVCPPQAKVGSPIAKFLRQMEIPGIAGVRVYGRRAGQLSPLWNYGSDFVHRRPLVPEATPEFAASDTSIDELLTPPEDAIAHPNVQPDDLKTVLERTGRRLQQWLCYSQLFVPRIENQEPASSPSQKVSPTRHGGKIAVIWSALGLLLLVQADLLIGQQLRSQPQSIPTTNAEGSPTDLSLPQLSLQKEDGKNSEGFNSSGFTREGEKSVIVDNSGRSSATTAAILAAARSPNPTFNNRLLDEKLALYQQRLLRSGVPDVLIIGSSRALRGVDPIALQDTLAAEGYLDVEVFNFGVNGATAQVVDLIVRKILTPEQLPKLIIWADGARAFNSGREDLTYNAIATSPGYQQLDAGTFPNSQSNAGSGGTPENTSEPAEQFLAAWGTLYQSLNGWLSQSLSQISSTYPLREQLKTNLRNQFVSWLAPIAPTPEQTETDKDATAPMGEAIDYDGFLPLSVRFNPATYYNEYARVPGAYDSDYDSFQPTGKQDTALAALLQFTQANDITVVFINLPLTDEYLDPVRTQYEQEFQEYMLSSGMSKGLIFRNLTTLWPTKYDYFSDPSHLNRHGAYEVSNKIAQDPMIPWSNVSKN
ncbi:MAG: DUF1574 domain-containing protein [Kastovskya adunca ATA6-11-RM4]|jgi:hypothetical protein|nr:DUF1574 domain-containing protein [Kastovskya adunca ATA6-11-RM4]